jgi:hypothetical protein
MSECPTCGRKLRGSYCPYCEEEVGVDDAQGATPVTGESMEAVFSSDSQWQADFVMSLLESEGIPTFKESADTIGDIPGSEDVTGDIVIMVEEEDADRAREAIEASRSELEEE